MAAFYRSLPTILAKYRDEGMRMPRKRYWESEKSAVPLHPETMTKNKRIKV